MIPRPTVYLAGPMTGIPDFNRPAFAAAAADLRAKGYIVANPGEIPEKAGEGWEYYMRQAIAHLIACDVVVRLDGWQDSRGAKIESQLAADLGMPVWDLPEFTGQA